MNSNSARQVTISRRSFVLAGAACVSLAGEDGQGLLLSRVERGEACVLTTPCLLGDRPYPAEGVVETALVRLALPARAVASRIERSAVFRRFLLAEIGGRRLDTYISWCAIAYAITLVCCPALSLPEIADISQGLRLPVRHFAQGEDMLFDLAIDRRRPR